MPFRRWRRVPRQPKRLRLAVVSPFIDKTHGTERRVAEWVARLKSVHEIHIYSARIDDLDMEGIVWHRVPWLPGPHLLSYLWWLLANSALRWWDARVRGQRFDLVYSPGINCFDADVVSVHVVFEEFYRRIRGQLALRNNPVRTWPVLFHRHVYYRLIIALERHVYHGSRTAIAPVSQQVLREVRAHFGHTGIAEVVYNGIDETVFNPALRQRLRADARAEFGFAADDFVVLLIGNGWRNKGLQFLIEAVARLPELPLRVIVAGSDDRRPFLDQIDRLHVEDRIRFVEPRRDVERFYAAADVYASPSMHDAFALPCVEAMASGLPVITSSANGGREIMEPGVNSYILDPPDDVDELVRLLRTLAADPALRARLGGEAAHTACLYTWERCASMMRTLFERVHGARSPGRAPAVHAHGHAPGVIR